MQNEPNKSRALRGELKTDSTQISVQSEQRRFGSETDTLRWRSPRNGNENHRIILR